MKYRIVRPIDFEFDQGQPKLFVMTEHDITKNLDKRASRVQMGARLRVRRRTGSLLSTIRKKPGLTAATQYVDVLAGGRRANYALVEHDGSRPHVIRPRRRKALRFTVRGVVVFRRKVFHPGTTGTFYLIRSLPLAAVD